MINFFIGVFVGATVGYIVAAVMHVASKGGENE
ncbi:DUF3789 domain-containing protein [Sharpea azabuensis]|nr:DUF3789 domain-containing protein [Sharpea azabuensis]